MYMTDKKAQQSQLNIQNLSSSGFLFRFQNQISESVCTIYHEDAA